MYMNYWPRAVRACRCPERRKPQLARNWVVRRRNVACSAFEGYRARWSAISTLNCHECGAVWPTKMDVSLYPDGDLFIPGGYCPLPGSTR